jgi:hypothetical protein
MLIGYVLRCGSAFSLAFVTERPIKDASGKYLPVGEKVLSVYQLTGKPVAGSFAFKAVKGTLALSEGGDHGDLAVYGTVYENTVGAAPAPAPAPAAKAK